MANNLRPQDPRIDDYFRRMKDTVLYLYDISSVEQTRIPLSADIIQSFGF